MATISEALTIALGYHQAGRLDMAEEIYRRILAVEPENPEALHLLGVVAHQFGRHAEAVDSINRAIARNPAVAGYHNNLGNVLQAQGKLAEAAASYRRALELEPGYAEGHNNLGTALRALEKLDEAVACYRQALALRPDYPEALNNLGVVQKDQNLLDDAVASLRRALELRPDYVEALNNLGNTLVDQGRPAEAIDCYGRVLQLRPELAETYNNLALALKTQGRLDEAMACYGRAMQLRPDSGALASNALCALRCHPDVTLAALSAAESDYERRHASPLRSAWEAHTNARDPERPLRLGFVSPRFAAGPVGAFLAGVLDQLDRAQWEIACYSDLAVPDPTTARFRAAAALWRDTAGISDEQLSRQIRADRIDILIDLAGHATRNRLPAFARKPAPLQITWIDSVGGTGLAAIDYLLADRHLVPAGAETFYRERILRLPDGYVCYEPPAGAPRAGPLPALGCGHVTFGSFNNPAKIHRQVVALWSRILVRVPGSCLVLKYQGLSDPGTRRHYEELFGSLGVSPERVEWQGWSAFREYFAEYNRIDIALDPFPHTGGLTTCDALWMGVPVITCPGETFASRQSLSHLSNVGVADTVAGSLDEYVEIAAALAADLPRLAEIRRALRARMAASPLCDARRFAADLGRLLRGAWRGWCQGGNGVARA